MSNLVVYLVRVNLCLAGRHASRNPSSKRLIGMDIAMVIG